MPSKSELINALKTLREECKSHKLCNECPLSIDGTVCVVNRFSPCHWFIEGDCEPDARKVVW